MDVRNHGSVVARPIARRKVFGRLWGRLGLGLLAAGALFASAGCQPGRGSLLKVYESKYPDVDRTCQALKAAIEGQGFTCKGILDLKSAMAKHGVALERTVQVVQFGRAASAREMLATNPEASALMPCSFGVYEGDDGRVYISSVNRKLIGRLVGGAVAKVMGQQIPADLEKALKGHVR